MKLTKIGPWVKNLDRSSYFCLITLPFKHITLGQVQPLSNVLCYTIPAIYHLTKKNFAFQCRTHLLLTTLMLLNNQQKTLKQHQLSFPDIITPDVCLIKSFKVNPKKCLTEWNSRDQATETKSGILKNLEVTLIAQWIKGA